MLSFDEEDYENEEQYEVIKPAAKVQREAVVEQVENEYGDEYGDEYVYEYYP